MSRRLAALLLLGTSCSGPDADPRSPDPHGRYLGVRELGENPREFDRIVSMLKDPHYLVVVGALEALAQIGRPDSLLYVAPVLHDKARKPMVRARACSTLAALRNPEGIGFLGAALADEDPWVRREAVKAIASYGATPEGLKHLVAAVGDKEPSVSYMAHLKLREITGRTDVPQSREGWDAVFKNP